MSFISTHDTCEMHVKINMGVCYMLKTSAILVILSCLLSGRCEVRYRNVFQVDKSTQSVSIYWPWTCWNHMLAECVWYDLYHTSLKLELVLILHILMCLTYLYFRKYCSRKYVCRLQCACRGTYYYYYCYYFWTSIICPSLFFFFNMIQYVRSWPV